MERTGRPAPFILGHEDGVAHGSGRSVPGFHLLNALTTAHYEGDPPLFTRFGGHAHAVGFSLPVSGIGALRASMARIALTLNFSDVPPLDCDVQLPLAAITDEFEAWLSRFAPFGMDNEEPVFLSADLALAYPPKLLKEMHLRLTLEDPASRRRISAVAWGRGEGWAPRIQQLQLQQGSRVDVAFRLRRNLHPDFGGLELEIVDLRPGSNSGTN